MSTDGTVDPEVNAPDPEGSAPEALETSLAEESQSPDRPLTRRQLVEKKRAQGRRNRPFIIGGFLMADTVSQVARH